MLPADFLERFDIIALLAMGAPQTPPLKTHLMSFTSKGAIFREVKISKIRAQLSTRLGRARPAGRLDNDIAAASACKNYAFPRLLPACTALSLYDPPPSDFSTHRLYYIDELLIRPGLHGLVHHLPSGRYKAKNRSKRRPQCEEQCETTQIPCLCA